LSAIFLTNTVLLRKTFHLKLPDSYVAFLKFSNGVLLYESDELFGTQRTVEGIGSLIETRAYKIAEFLPDSFLLSHDDGFENHVFDTQSQSETGEYCVVRWAPGKRAVTHPYLDVSQWVKRYLARKWE
jgi:hypothetical protein